MPAFLADELLEPCHRPLLLLWVERGAGGIGVPAATEDRRHPGAVERHLEVRVGPEGEAAAAVRMCRDGDHHLDPSLVEGQLGLVEFAGDDKSALLALNAQFGQRQPEAPPAE